MKQFILLVGLFCATMVYSQGETNNWYFGQNAGVRFDDVTGTVTAVSGGQINTLEGCTTISDTNGNLLFYTDGRTVWNRNHTIMPNGTGLNGDDSSTSSGLIVPKPNDATQYYIFTVDEPHHNETEATNHGLNYTLVDMTLDGGNGDVVNAEKNIPLVTYDPTDAEQRKYKAAEKITAVRSDDCTSFWVLNHFIDKFYAFKVETTGVNTTPVVSTTPTVVPTSGYRRNALGYLKASPDGSKLGVAHFGFATVTGGNAAGGVYLYDFDNSTGVVSNEIELYRPANGNSPYGVEFSKTGARFYATIGSGINGDGASLLHQWDLTAPDIPNSIVLIDNTSVYSQGALQLAIDGKIYRALYSFSTGQGGFLGVINNPENIGAAVNYVEEGVPLDVPGDGINQASRIGLPPFIQSLFNVTIDIIQNGISITNLDLCDGDTYTLTATDIPTGIYVWYRDGLVIPGATTHELVINGPGTYNVEIDPNNGECPIEGQAIVAYFDNPAPTQPNDYLICDDDSDSTEIFDFDTVITPQLGLDLTMFSVSYHTTPARDNSDIITNTNAYPNVTSPQIIYIKVENIGNTNCTDETLEFTIIAGQLPTTIPITNYELCDNNDDGDDLNGFVQTFNLTTKDVEIINGQANMVVSYHTNLLDATNNTNPIVGLYSNITAFTQTIFYRLQDTSTGCFNTGSFNLVVNPLPEVQNTTLEQCDGEDGTLDGLSIYNLTQANPF